jgi:Xaa-Pro aminopeptidase
MRHQARIDALASRLEIPLLVTKSPNLRYLTGFAGGDGYLLVHPAGRSVFLTDGRYGELAEHLLEGMKGVSLEVFTGDSWKALAGIMAGLGQVGLEAEGATWEFARSVETKAGVVPVPTSGLVEDLRRTKDPDEVAALQAAGRAADAAFGGLASLVEGAVTESDLAWSLVGEMRRHGGAPAGWDVIVAAGAGASIPHYETGPVPLGRGLLLLDFGCVVEGYHSDMSRTVWLDGEADAELERVHRAVAEARQAGVQAVRAGVRCCDVDEACRAVLRGYGYEEKFVHGTGHGVGLEIHELPWLRRGIEEVLKVGDAVTIEPGVYLPGVGGVRIEDAVLVGERGGMVLTESSREMTRR